MNWGDNRFRGQRPTKPSCLAVSFQSLTKLNIRPYNRAILTKKGRNLMSMPYSPDYLKYPNEQHKPVHNTFGKNKISEDLSDLPPNAKVTLVEVSEDGMEYPEQNIDLQAMVLQSVADYSMQTGTTTGTMFQLVAFSTEIIRRGNNVVFRTKIFDLPFKVPEIKFRQTICEGWTWGWCPPVNRCKYKWEYPCWKNQRRDSTYSFFIELVVPANIVENLENQIRDCHEYSLRIATDIVKTAALSGFSGAIFSGNPFTAPGAALQSAYASIPTAINWYLEMLTQCLNNLAEGLGNQIIRAITRPRIGVQKVTTPWR